MPAPIPDLPVPVLELVRRGLAVTVLDVVRH